MLYIIIGILFWVACGVLVYGQEMAYCIKGFPTLVDDDFYIDRRKAVRLSFCGPTALLSNYILGYNRHGYMFIWKKPEKEEDTLGI